MNNTVSPGHENLPWWRERMLWLVIVLPLSAVLASIATYFIAAHAPDDLVKAEYSKTGMVVESAQDKAIEATQRGLSGRLSYHDGKLELALATSGRPEERLTLSIVHPTRAELDQEIPMQYIGAGKYQAQIVLSGQGKRLLILEPPAHDWRLQGEWRAPFHEETRLSASGAHTTSTHP